MTAWSRWTLIAVTALSLLAALIHCWVLPEQSAIWWGYGVFFLVVASAQTFSVGALARSASPGMRWSAIVGNAALVGFWAVTRTVGVPIVGPRAGVAEPIGLWDSVATAAEALAVAGLVLLATADRASEPSRERRHMSRSGDDRRTLHDVGRSRRSRRLRASLAVLSGVFLLTLAIVSFAVPAGNTPWFIPGYATGSATSHVRQRTSSAPGVGPSAP